MLSSSPFVIRNYLAATQPYQPRRAKSAYSQQWRAAPDGFVLPICPHCRPESPARRTVSSVCGYSACSGRIYHCARGYQCASERACSPKRGVFRDLLYTVSFLNGCRLNWAIDDNGKSFYKLDVKVREKIVADGIDDPDFDPVKHGSVFESCRI